jgi:DNA-binding GntR family transcriptional regulator
MKHDDASGAAGAPVASAAENAYAATKAAILDGDVPAGSMLSEGDVATRLGISRTPVREAFLRLQVEGWLRLYPKRGALVVPPEPGEARDVLEARVLVETSGVSAASATAAGAEALALSMQERLEEQRLAHGSDDLAAFAEHDLAFHRCIVEAGGNALLLGFQDSLADHERRMSTRSLWRRKDSSELVLAQHAGLIEAVRRRDPGWFEERLREHLTTVHHRLLGP